MDSQLLKIDQTISFGDPTMHCYILGNVRQLYLGVYEFDYTNKTLAIGHGKLVKDATNSLKILRYIYNPQSLSISIEKGISRTF